MGVHGLWELLAPVGRHEPIETLYGKTVAIDISVWLTQFVRAMRDSEGAMLHNAHLLGIFRRCCKLLFHSIRPVFVFDGVTPPLKKRTLLARAAARDRQEIKIKRLAERLLKNRIKMDILEKSGVRGHKKRKNETEKMEKGVVDDSVREDKGNNVVVEAPTAVGLTPKEMLDEFADAALLAAEKANLVPDRALHTSSEDADKLEPCDDTMPEKLDEIQTRDSNSQQNFDGIRPLENPPSMNSQHVIDAVNTRNSSAMTYPYANDFEPEDTSIDISDIPLDVDEETLAQVSSLPPSVHPELFRQLRQRQRLVNRQAILAHANKSNPMSFSEAQIEAFLQTSTLNRKIFNARSSFQARGGSVGRIASDYRRSYLLEDLDEAGDVTPGFRMEMRSRKQIGHTSINDSGIGWAQRALQSGASSNGESELKTEIHNEEDSDESIEWEDEVEVNKEKRENKTIISLTGKGGVFEKGDSKVVKENFSDDKVLEEAVAPRARQTSPKGGDAHAIISEDLKEVNVEPREAVGQPKEQEVEAADKNVYDLSLQQDIDLNDVEARKREDSAKALGAPGEDRETVEEKETQPTVLITEERRNEGVIVLDQNQTSGKKSVLGLSEQVTSHTLREAKNQRSKDEKRASEDKDGQPFEGAPEETLQAKSTSLLARQAYLPPSSSLKPGLETNAESGLEVGKEQPPAEETASSPKYLPAVETGKLPQVVDEKVAHSPDRSSTRLATTTHVDSSSSAMIEPVVEDIDDKEMGSPKKEESLERSPKAQPKQALTPTEVEDLRQEIARESAELKAEQSARMKSTTSVSSEMFQETRELLNLFGIPFLDAPAEAEAQCAYLNAQRVVDAVITEDSDAFLFGARTVYKKVFSSSGSTSGDQGACEAYRIHQVIETLGIDRTGLIRLALLLGSDYTQGVRGVGIVNAMEILHAFPGETGLEEFALWFRNQPVTAALPPELRRLESSRGRKKRRKTKDEDAFNIDSEENAEKEEEAGLSVAKREEKDDDESDVDCKSVERRIFEEKHKNIRRNWVVGNDFPSSRVVEAYERPMVDKYAKRFEWQGVDYEGLGRFCWEKFGWTRDRFQRIIKDLKRSGTGSRRKVSIEYAAEERFARIRSERLRHAVGGLGGTGGLERLGDFAKEREQDVRNWKVADLKKALKILQLPRNGKKAELVARLKEALGEDEKPVGNPPE